MFEHTHVTAEAIVDRAVAAIGLPARDAEESLTDYVARVSAMALKASTKTETARCLGEAVAAAKVAAHHDVEHWLRQAANHVPKD